MLTTMDGRMKSFHPASEHLWGLGDVGDIPKSQLNEAKKIDKISLTGWVSQLP
jgi:hypothetical protein